MSAPNSWDDAAQTRHAIVDILFDAGLDSYDEEGDAEWVADKLMEKFIITPRPAEDDTEQK